MIEPRPDADPLVPDPMVQHETFMRRALQLAATAFEQEEVPVGALVVQNAGEGPRVIGEGYNQREQLSDPTAHAEMIALTAAAAELGSWRLEHCTLYVTLEPCPMCAGAIVNARVPHLVFGTTDPKAGATGSLMNLVGDSRLNHRATIVPGVLASDCRDILQAFFREQRARGKK